MGKSLHLTDLSNSHRAPSASEMAAYDRKTIEGGISGAELMERAGGAMFDQIQRRFPAASSKSGRITILCGPGNNGGDGLVIARKLHEAGRAVSLISLNADRYSEDHLYQAAKFLNLGCEILVLGGKGTYPSAGLISELSDHELQRILSDSAVVIDALFGTGQKDAPRGASAQLLNAVDAECAAAAKIAVDIPSGVSASTGEVYTPHFKAQITLTVEFVKRGMLQYPAREVCGDIFALPIGIVCSKESEFSVFDERSYQGALDRPENSHKGDYGRVLVIGGSPSYPGAPILTTNAAIRSGAGLVTLALPPALIAPEVPLEAIRAPLKGKAVFFKKPQFSELTKHLKASSSVAFGPGIGIEKTTRDFVEAALKFFVSNNTPAVIDADALNHLCFLRKKFRQKLKSVVLTPHPGEMARLLEIDTKAVQADRFSAARELSEMFSCCVVLKGAGTLIYSRGKGVINISGNPYMASGGSGDVLSGVIAALLSRKKSLLDAAAIGCYVHGLAADIQLRERRAPVIASDIVASLPKAFATLT